MSVDFRSLMGSTPFFSPSMGSANKLKASLISPSSCAVTLCSLASFDCRGFDAVEGPPDLRFGGFFRDNVFSFLFVRESLRRGRTM